MNAEETQAAIIAARDVGDMGEVLRLIDVWGQANGKSPLLRRDEDCHQCLQKIAVAVDYFCKGRRDEPLPSPEEAVAHHHGRVLSDA